MFNRIHLWSPLVLRFSLLESFVYWFNLFICCCSLQAIYSWLNLGRLYHLGIYQLLLDYPMCWCINISHSIFLKNFCDISCNICSFISDFESFLFFLLFYLRVCPFFFYLFKNSTLNFLVIYYFSILYHVCALIFITSYCKLGVCLFNFFLVSWGVKLECLFEIFILF